MPANLTPQYKKAEEEYRAALTSEEKLRCLENMLQVIPKHKGTSHMQADLKSRIAALRKELSGGGGKGKQRTDPFHVDRSGAGQVTLMGLPNAGKSALVGALSNAPVTVADYPFATRGPVPGMMHYQDAQIQLVDLPPVTAEHIEGGQIGAFRNSDVIWIVVDLAGHHLLDDVATLQELVLERLRVVLTGDRRAEGYDEEKRLRRSGLLIGTKIDLPKARDNFDAMLELIGPWLPAHGVSAVSREGLDALAEATWKLLGKMRVYAKKPGKPADMDEPFLIDERSTVGDLATFIHKEIAEKLKFARIWGSGQFEGQQVHADYVLSDKDIVELHV
jgi:ribosome-interacting GTPase 1